MGKQFLPHYFIIETTNLCNFTCPICPNALYESTEKGNMSWALFTELIDQISSVAKVIQLYWMGEPLLNDNIFQMIEYCKIKTNAKVMLSTNGSKLSSNVTNSLVRNGLDEIIISVDACDSQKIYSTIRVGGNLKELNENICYLMKHKQKMNVVLQFIDMYINRSEKEPFLSKWGIQDCTVNIQCLYTWANQFPSLNLASDNLSTVAKKKRIPCADLWNKMAIHWDGKVSACCFDWNSRLTFGDAKDESLISIWNNKKTEYIRYLHTTEEYDAISLCKDCNSWAEPNEYKNLYNL
ncbi:hypothetical protein FACS1894190_11340 [Spirochaetia bacterium]|nr:hypothetical protein FACS1894190_11340 [Spirochaetia bacterium]